MAEPESIVELARGVLGRGVSLQGVKVVVTAGGTREPLDPVRYVGNRSSGRMGYALADAAIAAGAKVTLITGPTSLDMFLDATVVRVDTASEMQAAVEDATADADVLIMAAAVADYRPESPQNRKIKKEKSGEHVNLRLVRNPDILAGIDRPRLVKIGFAAETEDLVENAARKLRAKNLAMIVANDAKTTIGAAETVATILTADGTVRTLPRMTKEALAAEIIRCVAELLAKTGWHEP